MKATEQYFPVVLFIMPYKVVLPFESVGEILKCDHSNESNWAALSSVTLYYAVQGGSNFWVCGWNAVVWPFKWNFFSITSQCPVCFSAFYKEKFGIFVEFWLWPLLEVKGLPPFSQLTTQLPSKPLEILFNISIHHLLVLWKIQVACTVTITEIVMDRLVDWYWCQTICTTYASYTMSWWIYLKSFCLCNIATIYSNHSQSM